jgi:hypothetical protein
MENPSIRMMREYGDDWEVFSMQKGPVKKTKEMI